MIEELSRYRDLAIALIVSVLLSVATFAVFLQFDMERARTHFTAVATIAIRQGEKRVERLLHFALGIASNADAYNRNPQLAADLLLRDDLLELVSTVCELHDGNATMLHTNGSQTDCELQRSVSIPIAGTGWGQDKQIYVVVNRTGVGDQTTYNSDSDLDPPASLALHIDLAPGHRVILSVDLYELLEAFKPDGMQEGSIRGIVCLDVYLEKTFTSIVCDDDPSLPERGSIGFLDTELTTDEQVTFYARGLQWRVSSRPSAEDLTRQISATPFIIFSATVLFCGLICWFIFRSADKSVKLDRKNRELANMVKKLGQQNQDLDQFAVMAAHDLQAPLRFMVSNAHYLDTEIAELHNPELEEYSGVIIEQGERMRALILDLLAFCRAGQDELKMSSVNARSLIDHVISDLMQNKDYAGARFVIGDLPSILTSDEGKLIQVFQNLIDNALKFSRQHSEPTVCINATRDEEWSPWQFVVQDNGCGISEEYRERIFRPFNRLDPSFAGTGVGLAIVKKLIERLRGRVWVESAPDGHGTRFVFTLSNLTEEAMT